jgi:RNA polymerase sigma factor (sigma-70 family)
MLRNLESEARTQAVFNPFAECADTDSDDAVLVEEAKSGNRSALEQLILRHQAWVYNIAVRMVFEPHDAEEVTQEVLIKAVTRLSAFRGECQFRTWLYRIAANHVFNMQRRGAESQQLSFAAYGTALDNTPDLDLPDPKSVPVEVPLLVEEAKIACTTGMLLCLDRKQRLIFVLGEVFGASDSVGSEILEVTADNFRQSLARARRDLYRFMHDQCGLVNTANPCRCPKKTKGFIDAGHVDPHRLQFVPRHVQRIKEAAAETAREIEDLAQRQYADIYREHPYLQPADQIAWLRQILERRDVRSALQLD